MAGGFASGSAAVPQGVVEFDVSNLDLTFTPTGANVSVRQPSTDADLVTAFVCGAPTASGFHVALSAPVSQTGYCLDWTVFADGASPTPAEPDTLQVTYTDLKNEVARFLGYNTASLTAAQASEVDSYIQGGIRNFYYPPALNGVDPNYEWSFLRTNGEIALTAGTSEYLLPGGFGAINGQPVFKDASVRTSLPVIAVGEITRLLNSPNAASGRPRFVAICSANQFGSRGQRKTLLVYPKPDAAYTLIVRGDGDAGRLSADTRPYPLGGPRFSELITESCLAVAEQKANDEIGIHTQNFNTLLVSMIQADRKSGAQVFGAMGDPNYRHVW